MLSVSAAGWGVAALAVQQLTAAGTTGCMPQHICTSSASSSLEANPKHPCTVCWVLHSGRGGERDNTKYRQKIQDAWLGPVEKQQWLRQYVNFLKCEDQRDKNTGLLMHSKKKKETLPEILTLSSLIKLPVMPHHWRDQVHAVSAICATLCTLHFNSLVSSILSFFTLFSSLSAKFSPSIPTDS